MDVQLFEQIPHVTGFLLLDSLLAGNFTVLKDAAVHIILPCLTCLLYTSRCV